MKHFLTFLLFFGCFSICSATTLDEIVKLTNLKTSDDLIIQLIQKSPLTKEVTSEDVVRLKEQGVSERVIDALWNQKGSKLEEKNIRVYNSTTKDGRPIQVVTNLDENGNRMGPPAPPPMEPIPYKEPEPPKEVRVIVENQVPPPPEPEEPPAYGPYDYPSGIPLDYLSYGGYGYYPNYGYNRNGCMFGDCNFGNHHGHGGVPPVVVRHPSMHINRSMPQPVIRAHPSSAGTRRPITQ